MRLIDADLLKPSMCSHCDEFKEGKCEFEYKTCCAAIIIDSQPTVDAKVYDRDYEALYYEVEEKYQKLCDELPIVYCMNCKYFEERNYDFCDADGMCFYWNCHATVKDGYCFRGKLRGAE